MSKSTYLPLILIGYRKQTKHTSSGLSDTFQTIDRQSDFHPNHKWVMCNYPKNKSLSFTHINIYIYIYITRRRKQTLSILQQPNHINQMEKTNPQSKLQTERCHYSPSACYQAKSTTMGMCF